MRSLLGVPVGTLAAALAILLIVLLAAIAVMALRNRVFFRLGVRNVGRRPGRTALIVAGSMLGTAIIAAALATGDTMSQTIRSAATAALGPTDEVIAATGADTTVMFDPNRAASTRYFPAAEVDAIAAAAARTGLVDGVTPVIVEPVALQDRRTRQNEPRVTLFASDPARLRAFGSILGDGRAWSLSDLAEGEVFLNAKAADELGAGVGDTVRILAGGSTADARVKAIVRYDGGGTADSGLLMPLAPAQRLLGKQGLVQAVFVSNSGGPGATDAVIRALRPALATRGLAADDTKQELLRDADKQGAMFMSMFTTFGSFSIAAGILLVFLIFVMLAAERRGELGIARAIGTRRRHLVQMFLYEGIAYDVLAAAVGALLGIAIAFVMVLGIASAFATSGITMRFAVSPESVVIAYAIGVLLTLAVVTFSAWRVSRMNIVSAIRDLPEPAGRKGPRYVWVIGVVAVALGVSLIVSGYRSQAAMPLGFGVLLVVLGLVPISRALGARDRIVYTTAGLTLVAWFVLPVNTWLFGTAKLDFSIFILSGLAIVVGASWTIVYNADVLLGALSATAGRNRRLAPVLRVATAYPLRSLFRTGVTLAMFTLVVFTLVTGAITTGSFVHGVDDIGLFGGGFDIRSTTSPAAPVSDMTAALRSARGLDAADFRLVSDQSQLPVAAAQVGVGARPETYLVHGVDTTFLDNTTYGFGAIARGYGSAAAVWRALRDHPGLAVVDPLIVQHKTNFNFGALSSFRIRGFYVEDRTFDPVQVDVADPQTGGHVRLTVIGVLPDTIPLMMAGLWTSQRTMTAAFGDRAVPTVHLFAVRPGVDSGVAARRLESAFFANGMQADSLRQLLADAVSASLTFDRLIEGFMGLGLIVGVAALGVISARAVVERRQQIGVLRSIGFRSRMVQMTFLLEASFIALTSIVVGTALGLAVAWNVIDGTRRQPSWSSLTLEVPWAVLAGIFILVYAVAMLTTLVPARRASRIYPAEALRYQ